ncbi:MAG: hypothetical protein EZS26_000328 [Candidatus Ordinivivax streblomastigis]|uniref:Aminoglycoside phosphotransferase domain-containing protein n=1 Tax=Candidatus Ordinivivax streblomastigis TaxID=2540710 RepID=A0A5M8P5G8_9BACT|nr:MAG: hypothetical protein EZS26_000328 [Candidatus Ordinivivax streblomastigis]
MTNIHNLLNHILNDNSGYVHYTFSNTDGKTWLMPQNDMKTAMNLYQPSGIKGKLMKRFFPYFHRIKPLRTKLGIAQNRYELQNSLKDLLSQIFHSDNFQFSVFCGTPSNHQKITVQISKGSNILGYCKISDRENIKQLFSREEKILNTLKAKNINQIPECLYCGSLTDNIDLFVQSTVKTNHSKVLHKWNSQHWAFLANLKQQTEQILPFEQTDYFRDIDKLRQNQSYLSIPDRNMIDSAIDKVMDYYGGKLVTFCAYHADFTPWNMFLEQNQLFVFDFEYAQLTYPPYLDWFHFFTQCCIFEERLNANEIYNAYLIQKRKETEYLKNSDFYYLCYLLNILSLYLEREKGLYNNHDVKKSLSIWLKLIYFLI